MRPCQPRGKASDGKGKSSNSSESTKSRRAELRLIRQALRVEDATSWAMLMPPAKAEHFAAIDRLTDELLALRKAVSAYRKRGKR
jgi:hypothetical protein